MSAAHFCLNRLVVVVDNNGLQTDATNEEIMNIEPLASKWASFGWTVLEEDGPWTSEIDEALDEAEDGPSGPTVLIARTTKGKGVSFMEDAPEWHGSVQITEEQLWSALHEPEVTGTRQDEMVSGRLWNRGRT